MVSQPAAVGWEYLMDGEMINAVYHMFDQSFGGLGLVTVMLFVLYQIMLYQKTQNITLMWIIGIMFAALYSISSFYEPFSMQIIFLLLVFQLGGILYLLLFAK